MKRTMVIPILVALAGCAMLNAPTSAGTLAEAINADTLAVRIADTYVQTGMPNAATLRTLAADADAVHAALKSLEADQAAGRPLNFAAFNAANAAFNSYRLSQGIK